MQSLKLFQIEINESNQSSQIDLNIDSQKSCFLKNMKCRYLVPFNELRNGPLSEIMTKTIIFGRNLNKNVKLFSFNFIF